MWSSVTIYSVFVNRILQSVKPASSPSSALRRSFQIQKSKRFRIGSSQLIHVATTTISARSAMIKNCYRGFYGRIISITDTQSNDREDRIRRLEFIHAKGIMWRDRTNHLT